MLNLLLQYGQQYGPYYGTQSSVFTRMGFWFERIGLLDAILPFLLIFAIVFASLQKSSLFGTNKRKINLVVSLVISLVVVIPHLTNRYPPGYDVVLIINSVIPQVTIVFVAIVLFLVLIGIFGGKAEWGTALSGLALLVSFVAIIVIFLRSIGTVSSFPTWLTWLDDPDLQALIVVILVFGIIVWFVTSEPGQGSTLGKVKDFLKGLTE